MAMNSGARLSHSLAISLLARHVAVVSASSTSSASSSRLVMGLGPALFAMVVLAVVCLLLCAFGYASQRRMLATGVVAAIAGCTALFFATVKVESAADSASPSTAMKYNRMVVARAVIAAVMISFATVALLSVFVLHVLRPRQGRHLEDNCELARGLVERRF